MVRENLLYEDSDSVLEEVTLHLAVLAKNIKNVLFLRLEMH